MAPRRFAPRDRPGEGRLGSREGAVDERDGIVELDLEALLVDVFGNESAGDHRRLLASVVEVEACARRGSFFSFMATAASLETWLRAFLGTHGGVAGTVHERRGDALELSAAVNIPPPVVRATEIIPKGKGMAGLAWERNRSVATCNIKTDETGDVRPGAKAVDAQAALAIPVRGADGEVRAVVGIAFLGEREFPDAELQAFEQAAGALPL
jgi:hypothetical protein